MGSGERLAMFYAVAVVLTIMVAIAGFVLQIQKEGGICQYYKNRGFERRHCLRIAEGVALIIVITWVFTPAMTYHARHLWLDRD